jgi:uncharacterized protein YegP (UPF0339 family)
MNADGATRGPGGGWHNGAGERQFLQRHEHGFASNDAGFASQSVDLNSDSDIECRFEVFRADEQAVTSTLFSGGDWRWRLVTTDGLVLAEASGYPSEGTCRAAVAVLQKRAAGAPVVSGAGVQP